MLSFKPQFSNLLPKVFETRLPYFIKNKKIPYPAGIQRSRIGVFLTSEEVRGDNDMEDEPLFIASLQGEGRSQI